MLVNSPTCISAGRQLPCGHPGDARACQEQHGKRATVLITAERCEGVALAVRSYDLRSTELAPCEAVLAHSQVGHEMIEDLRPSSCMLLGRRVGGQERLCEPQLGSVVAERAQDHRY